jgi:hypothetical protein
LLALNKNAKANRTDSDIKIPLSFLSVGVSRNKASEFSLKVNAWRDRYGNFEENFNIEIPKD